MKQNKPLFEEFKPSSYEEWKGAAEELLKGAPFEKKMFTSTPEGITLKPIYNKEDAPSEVSLPGFGNYVRGTDAASNRGKPWDVSQELSAKTPAEFNKEILDALSKGQTSVEIVLDTASANGLDADEACSCKVCDKGLSASTSKDFEAALDEVCVHCVNVNVHTGAYAAGVAALLYAAKGAKDFAGGIYFDPIGKLAEAGELPRSLKCAYDEMADLVKYNVKHAPKFGAIGVDTFVYSNAGASAVEELAFGFATAVEYLRQVTERGVSVDDAAKSVRFRLSLGSNFFMELAKIRAARAIWAKIVEEFGGSEDARKLRLNVRTAFFNKTVYDPYVNLLRTATEAFAGALGAPDSMTVGAFDEIIRTPDEFSNRFARNQQIIIQEECNLTEVIDPAGGSYFVENLTLEVAKKTWEIFSAVEAKGGIVKALEAGYVQDLAGKTFASRKKACDSRRSVVVGTNMYANMTEKPLAKPECSCKAKAEARAKEVKAVKKAVSVCVKDLHGEEKIAKLVEAAKAGASLQTLSNAVCECSKKECKCGGGEGLKVAALKPVRRVEHFEALRGASEAFKAKTGAAPKVFLATMGPLVQHKVRADFIRGFFEVAGFDAVYPSGFASAQDAANAFKESGAKIAVICSTDDTYPELVPAVTKAIKAVSADAVVNMAGIPAPELEESFKQAGLDGSVSIKSNNYETLKGLLVKLGVI